MSELLTAAQMRAIEQSAIQAGAVTGLELMERAGAGIVTAVLERWPNLAKHGHRAVVLCGPGNNGGDGFVVARMLAALRWTVTVFFYGDADKLPADAKTNYERWCTIGTVQPLDHKTLSAFTALDRDDPEMRGIVVDAVFGTGLTRPLEDDLALCLGHIRSVVPFCYLHYVVVDVHSGLCADSGRVLLADSGGARHDFATDMTVSFHRAKTGHYLDPACSRTAELKIVDIGLDEIRKAQAYDAFETVFSRISQSDDPIDAIQHSDPSAIAPLDPVGAPDGPVQLVDGYDAMVDKSKVSARHKFDYGHALVLSGGPGRTGAARLAARGALRIGAGLVTLGVPPSAQLEVAGQITAVMLTRVRDDAGLRAVLEDARINALCLGPGLGLGDHAAGLVEAALDDSHARPVVFDADALTLIAQDPGRMAALHARCVLTPHGGEFARLFPKISERLKQPATRGPAYSKLNATRDAAALSGAIVLFKGIDTVIAHPGGHASIHAAAYGRDAPWLATAGAGDVLAGFITGLLACGFDAMTACETAAWLHVECARAFGPGLIAEDLPEVLPKVLRALSA